MSDEQLSLIAASGGLAEVDDELEQDADVVTSGARGGNSDEQLSAVGLEEGERDLGGWSPEELSATVTEMTGVGEDVDLTDDLRFLRGAVKALRNRLARSDDEPHRPAIFLLHPGAPASSSEQPLQREYTLDAGAAQLCGRIFFVNPPVVSGYCQSIVNDGGFNDLVEYVTCQLALGSTPAVVFDRQLGEHSVRYYPQGLGMPDEVELKLLQPEISTHDIMQCMERVYEQCLKTPDAQPPGCKLWNRDGHPEEHAESRIQALLKPALVGAFPVCQVYHEYVGTSGRADLHLRQQDPEKRNSHVYVAVMELKVLRSRGSGGRSYSEQSNVKAVQKGIKQAIAYRQEHGHRLAFLFCFDMRDDDTGEQCFDTVLELANEEQVGLHRWQIFSSADDYRNASV